MTIFRTKRYTPRVAVCGWVGKWDRVRESDTNEGEEDEDRFA